MKNKNLFSNLNMSYNDPLKNKIKEKHHITYGVQHIFFNIQI